MKKTLLIICGFIPFCLFAQLKGQVVRVYDSNSLSVMTDKCQLLNIKLYGVNTFPLKSKMGYRAWKFLSKSCFGKQILIEPKSYFSENKLFAIVYLDSVNLNESMLINGMGWCPDFQIYLAKYLSVENENKLIMKNKYSVKNTLFLYW